MAVPAELEPKLEFPEGLAKSQVPDHMKQGCMRAAELYGLGYSRKQIAEAIADSVYGNTEMRREDRILKTRGRLRTWEKYQWFRDMVWDRAVVELDMSTPQILRGIANKAKRGRVDAAKLALAVTGRHKDRDETVPSAVTINLGFVPRPNRQAVDPGHDISLEAESVDED